MVVVIDRKHGELLDELRKSKLEKQELEEDINLVVAERTLLEKKITQLNAAYKERYKAVSIEKNQKVEEMRAKWDKEREGRAKAERELEAMKASLSGQIKEAAAKAVRDFKASLEFVNEYWAGMADCHDLVVRQSPGCKLSLSLLWEEMNRAKAGAPRVDTPRGDRPAVDEVVVGGNSSVPGSSKSVPEIDK